MMNQVDFIAYHDLQAQAGQSIFEEMSKSFECRWKIGPNQLPSGADIAVMLDHTSYHPKVKKAFNGYRYLFHLSHDLGDVEIYKSEQTRLKEFDIIFVPSPLHFKYAKEQLGKETIVLQTGWAKYDKMQFSDEYKDVESKIKRLPYKYTIMYAPTSAGTYEWKSLFPLLEKLQCNIIIKNHIIVNKGQAFPEGQEAEYKQHLESADQMEKYILDGHFPNMIVAPRGMNICSLFPYVDLLISDQSSVLLEFAPFGISIETGRHNLDENDFAASLSRLSEDVVFLDKVNLCEVLSSAQKVEEFANYCKSRREIMSVESFRDISISTGKLTTHLIEKYFQEVESPSFLQHKSNLIARIFNRSMFEKKQLEDKMVAWRALFIKEESEKSLEQHCLLSDSGIKAL